ncbi:MAG: NifU family protein, partial [Hymenobacter sp.]
EQALDTLRPYLATDGGNVRVAEITPDGVLKLEWEGACGGDFGHAHVAAIGGQVGPQGVKGLLNAGQNRIHRE